MNYFFLDNRSRVYVLQTEEQLLEKHVQLLTWLFDGAELVNANHPLLTSRFKGPRRELPTPWSTVAVEICHRLNIPTVVRVEEFLLLTQDDSYDYMFQEVYEGLKEPVFKLRR